MPEVYVVLDNVRSAYNVGAIFRTAEGVGVKKIFLGGYTPAPRDRFGRIQSEIEKTSLGANEMVAWEAVDNVQDIIHRLQAEDVTVVTVEQTPMSQSLATLPSLKKIAYVFGNEITGVSPAICEQSDHVVMLPMLGQKESLNVSVTVGIVLYYQLMQSL